MYPILTAPQVTDMDVEDTDKRLCIAIILQYTIRRRCRQPYGEPTTSRLSSWLLGAATIALHFIFHLYLNDCGRRASLGRFLSLARMHMPVRCTRWFHIRMRNPDPSRMIRISTSAASPDPSGSNHWITVIQQRQVPMVRNS